MIKELARKAETHLLAAQQEVDLGPALFDIKLMITDAVMYFENKFPNSSLLDELKEAKGDLSEITKEKIENVAAIILSAEKISDREAENAKKIFDLNF